MVSSPVPVLGPFVPFARNPIRFVRQCYDKYGGVFTVCALLRPAPPCCANPYPLDTRAHTHAAAQIPMMGRRLTFMLGAGNHDVFFNARDQAADQAAVYKFMTPVFGKGIVRARG